MCKSRNTIHVAVTDSDFVEGAQNTFYGPVCPHTIYQTSCISKGAADIMMPNQLPFHSGSNTSIQVTCPIFQTVLFVHSVFMLRVGIGFLESTVSSKLHKKATAKIAQIINILITARTMLLFLLQSDPRSRTVAQYTGTLAQIKACYVCCFN